MNIFGWTIVRSNTVGLYEKQDLYKGKRILTKRGPGVISGGCIHVEMDSPILGKDGHQICTNQTFNIAKDF